MTKTITRIYVFWVFVCLFVPVSALAHKPLLLVEENDEGGILIEAGFSTGESGAGFKLFLKEKATGRLLEVFTIPEESLLEIPMPSVPYTVTFDAGEGHIVTKEGPFPAASPTAPQAVTPDLPEVAAPERQADREEPTTLSVISALPPVFLITSVLCQDSAIQVVNICPPDVTVHDQASWLHEHEDEVKDLLQRADAVVTIRQAWSQDPLYRYARRWNIRVIELDASAPFDPGLSGVSLLDKPEDEQTQAQGHLPSGKISPYIWLSLSNASIMADTLAADLKRLLPKETERITSNLARFKQQVFALKTRYELKFAELEALETATLTDRLVYLTGDVNLPVVGYFLKDDYYWTDDDFDLFRQMMLDHDVKVVVHTWPPNAAITQIIHEAGATLAVLDTLERTPANTDIPVSDLYLHIMEHNLETLLEALSASQE